MAPSVTVYSVWQVADVGVTTHETLECNSTGETQQKYWNIGKMEK